ncbi:hypothetical protein DFP72DRAFT_1020223 [Ephemerocybe angulata]|uniref:Fungal-type protein kinase domain-containing protein n=1 Tax=Ephemerocybe angulata TaxID=980116 RepID=A0A8H6HBP1_9AGAR|nr:hypothetical protein DFP72DRAFT_1020223 [Tulosesus angulatus]
MEELGTEIKVLKSNRWIKTRYQDRLSKAEIKLFLEKPDSGYDPTNRTWTGIPESPDREDELYTPLVLMIERILEEFVSSDEEGVSRNAVDTHDLDLKHDNNIHSTKPDICIVASGPSFKDPSPDLANAQQLEERIGYCNVASVFDAKLDSARRARKKQAIQLFHYCRQIFIQQPNRNFVQSLILTETSVRLVHFDHSGMYMTKFINFHDDPYTIVRLIVSLSNVDESILGFDTTVKWALEKDASGLFKRVSGTVTVTNGQGNQVVYDLIVEEDPFIRASIRGRGTTCWLAIDPNTSDRVLIKDSWRTETRTPESEFLEAAKGVPGVAQIKSYTEDYAQTKDYRPSSFSHIHFHNRVKTRLVTPYYGPSVENFTSRYQFVSAMRDAILAHLALFRLSILHRDITAENILLGLPGASRGERGILIDLDMAIWIGRDISEVNVDEKTGLDRFLSIALLRSRVLKVRPIHSILDDLESFYYVMHRVMTLYERPGVQVSPEDEGVSAMGRWDADSGTAQSTKSALMLGGGRETSGLWWGEPSDTLLRRFHGLLRDILVKQDEMYNSKKLTEEQKRSRHEALGSNIRHYYEELEKMFETALLEIQTEDLEAEGYATGRLGDEVTDETDIESAPPSSPSPCEPPTRRGNLKRLPSEELIPEDGTGFNKRNRTDSER